MLEKENDKSILIEWFKNKWIEVNKEQAEDIVNILRNIVNKEKEITEMLNSALENWKNPNELFEILIDC